MELGGRKSRTDSLEPSRLFYLLLDWRLAPRQLAHVAHLQAVLRETEAIPFLAQGAATLLREARAFYYRANLDVVRLIQHGNDTVNLTRDRIASATTLGKGTNVVSLLAAAAQAWWSG